MLQVNIRELKFNLEALQTASGKYTHLETIKKKWRQTKTDRLMKAFANEIMMSNMKINNKQRSPARLLGLSPDH